MYKINIAKDFSDAPGGRYVKEGKFSGEEFREELLVPKYIEANEKGVKLLIDLDGTYGYATSFLDEAFGGLGRRYPNDDVASKLDFISKDQPGIVEVINKYIKNS